MVLLHDRVGEVLSVGLRRLDLQEIDGIEAPSGEGSIARERAALIGGRVSVSSMPGHGTRVDLRIPLPESG